MSTLHTPGPQCEQCSRIISLAARTWRMYCDDCLRGWNDPTTGRNYPRQLARTLIARIENGVRSEPKPEPLDSIGNGG